jgi:hypothetical protein
MRWFTTPARPGRPGSALRARLRLEQLDYRAVPSSLSGMGNESLEYFYRGGDAQLTVAPQIVDFVGFEVGSGWYRFTGRVQGPESCGGLTVSFGGVPSLRDEVTTTLSDGSFVLLVQVRTDGSDQGTVTAQTTADGLASNVATYTINPT